MSETNVFFISAETVINMQPNEIRELSQKNRRAAFLSKTLGYACRFRGVSTVKALFESAEAISNYMDRSWMLYILNISSESPSGRNFADIPKTAILQNGKTLEQIPDSERAEVLKYFYENSEKCGFIPSELLFCSFFAHDDFITGELKKRGVKLSSEYVEMLTRNIPIDGCLSDYITLLKNLTNEDFIYVVSNLYGETGQKICCNEQIFSDMKERFSDPNIVELFKTKFSSGKLKVTKRLRSAIDLNDVSELSLGGTVGWLDDPRRRDSLIEYAQKNDKRECTAWLLDFKNRHADLAAERARAERKLKRELNAAPDSVTILRTLWGFKKLGDGTLMITLYKGNQTEITVPKKIGKGIVTAITDYVFSPKNPKINAERSKFFKTIKKVTIPDTVVSIGSCVFEGCRGLSTVDIPDSVKYIGYRAFCDCKSLSGIVVPDSVAEIGVGAFKGSGIENIKLSKGISYISYDLFNECENLREVIIPDSVNAIFDGAFFYCKSLSGIVVPDGVEVIGAEAFIGCKNLKTVVLPKSIKYIGYPEEEDNPEEPYNLFGFSEDTAAVVERGSYAEEYCKRNEIPYTYKEETKNE